MTPFWTDDHLTLYGGDCREVLASMPAESVHCVVTSPPYWGLRDYGVSDQLGLEPTPEEYVANMVAVFREVRRVLRNDGTLWLNLGDSYNAGTSAPSRPSKSADVGGWTTRSGDAAGARRIDAAGLKPKDLVGVPWRVAFALQADGWYLRSDIIWAKPNPMPESVTDRPTKAHEYLFLLSKAPRYYFDADAVREAPSENSHGGLEPNQHKRWSQGLSSQATTLGVAAGGRNLRSVWTIATEPYPGAHFATFPRKLVEPCIKAGTSERGVCPECGAPWERVVEREMVPGRASGRGNRAALGDVSASSVFVTGMEPRTATTGWRPTCIHGDWVAMTGGAPQTDKWRPVPATVLDPFAGSGTTLLVAQSLGRRGVGIDLNPDYLKQALVRNAQTPLGLVG